MVTSEQSESSHVPRLGKEESGLPKSVFGQIAEVARYVFRCDAVLLRISDPKHKLLHLPGVDADHYSGPELLAISSNDAVEEKLGQLGMPSLLDPFAAAAAGILLYVGLPIRSRTGALIGLLAAVGVSPRPLADEELVAFERLASIVADIADSG